MGRLTSLIERRWLGVTQFEMPQGACRDVVPPCHDRALVKIRRQLCGDPVRGPERPARKGERCFQVHARVRPQAVSASRTPVEQQAPCFSAVAVRRISPDDS